MGHSTGAAYTPSAAYLAIKPDISGNAINGLGETAPRQASPTVWHNPDLHPFGAVRELFAEAHRHPKPVPVADWRIDRASVGWTGAARAFALADEANLFVPCRCSRSRQRPSTADNVAGRWMSPWNMLAAPGLTGNAWRFPEPTEFSSCR